MGRWLKGEPRLRDVLADPVIGLMMRRDRVDPGQLRAFLRDINDARVSSGFRGRPAGFADFECSEADELVR
jgi:hypothetical protein